MEQQQQQQEQGQQEQEQQQEQEAPTALSTKAQALAANLARQALASKMQVQQLQVQPQMPAQLEQVQSYSCKSLVPTATDYWCQTVCGVATRCPKQICECTASTAESVAAQMAMATALAAPAQQAYSGTAMDADEMAAQQAAQRQ